ncbi:MAG: hypothetical protein RL670_1019 [Actinomycetota bacterium]|jgi:Fur family ferric uptake transcriptional regulator
MTTKRNTWQKDAVRHALGEAIGFVSAQQLHGILRDHGSTISLATVYRALTDLVATSEADTISIDAGEALYRACAATHHHHLTCRKCGKTVEIEAAEVESWADSIAKQHGFTDPSHTLEISGWCADCR